MANTSPIELLTLTSIVQTTHENIVQNDISDDAMRLTKVIHFSTAVSLFSQQK